MRELSPRGPGGAGDGSGAPGEHAPAEAPPCPCEQRGEPGTTTVVAGLALLVAILFLFGVFCSPLLWE